MPGGFDHPGESVETGSVIRCHGAPDSSPSGSVARHSEQRLVELDVEVHGSWAERSVGGLCHGT